MSFSVFFLRHGQAGSRSEWKGDDAKRPLTADGKKRMERAAAAIAKLGVPLELIITSPLVRALQTAEIVAGGRTGASGLITDKRVGPGFGPDHLAAIVAEHRRAKGLLLVGHEPDFSQMISHLTGGGRLVMKKGGLARVDLEDPASLRGTLVWLLPPKVLER
jgi:phosphohistidine phosphatase